MQAVRKARKDAHTGEKAHFFYRINRKEGNKGNKKRRGKEERRQRIGEKTDGEEGHPEALKDDPGRNYNFLSYDIFFNRIFFEQIKPTKAKQGTNYRKKTSLLYLYISATKFLSRLVKSPKQTPPSRIYQKRKRRKNFFLSIPTLQ